MELGLFAIAMLVIVVLTIMFGIPVAFSLAGVSVFFAFFLLGQGFIKLFPVTVFRMMTEYVFVAVPLFIFMGAMLERAGIAEGL